MSARGSAGEAGSERLDAWQGRPVEAWRRAWAVPVLEIWDVLTSTNDRARSLASGGAAAGAVVIAGSQSAGRGRSGRSWDSPPDLGLWVSFVIDSPAPDRGSVTPLLLGLAVCRAAEACAPGLDARLKWPNDVLVNGRKLAGVLCERTGPGSIVAGVGVNVRQRAEDFDRGVRDRATSLGREGFDVALGDVADVLVRSVTEVARGPLDRLDPPVMDEIARRDALRGRPVTLADGSRGVARGIDEHGRLLVEAATGVLPVIAGDVVVTARPGDAREEPEPSGARSAR